MVPIARKGWHTHIMNAPTSFGRYPATKVMHLGGAEGRLKLSTLLVASKEVLMISIVISILLRSVLASQTQSAWTTA